MRFSTFSLFALSSLFLGAFAAPTPNQVRDVAVVEVEQRDASITAVEERTLPEIVVIVDSLVTEVFTITKSINITISGCEGIDVSISKKIAIIASIQAEFQKIIAAFSGAILKIYKLELITLIEADFKFLISAVLKVFIEIVYTLLFALKVLQISIIELLGFTLGLYLNVFIAFIVAIGKVVVDFKAAIKIAFEIYLSIIGKIFADFGLLLHLC